VNPHSANRLIIHATNVHNGGGRSLLNALLLSMPIDIKVHAQLDARMNGAETFPLKLAIRYVPATIFRRLLAEYRLARDSMPNDVTLCFGNLPPLFMPRGHVVVFLQNRYLIDSVKLRSFPFKTRLRLYVERFWLAVKMTNACEYIVQTPSMKKLLEEQINRKVPIRVLPFIKNHENYTRELSQKETHKEISLAFLYVASGEPHKNHRCLIEAWCLLAKEGIFPSLKLTLDKVYFSELSHWAQQQIEQYQLNIENLGSLPHKEIIQLYKQVTALIYPSTFESFGLPLIEARKAGLPILAAELDYVRDVIDPEQTFDPESAVSIARAVKRFIGIDEQPLSLLNATGFIEQILKRAE